MSYTKSERLEIGKLLYHNEITKAQAVDLYKISPYTARDYMRYYRDSNNLPPKNLNTASPPTVAIVPSENHALNDYDSMTKDELIRELVKSKINEARLKKGYIVKGVGRKKEFFLLDKKNIK